MNPIQPTLLVIMLGSLVFYLVRLRSTLRDRLIAAALFVLGGMAVLFPNVTSWIAQRLGVGRGTDLVLYLAVVTGAFVAVLFYSRTMRLEDSITELTRAIALARAERHECPSPTGDEPPVSGRAIVGSSPAANVGTLDRS